LEGKIIQLEFFQVTVSKSHHLKLYLLRSFIEALTKQGLVIDEKTRFTAIVPRENFDDFKFGVPVGDLEMIEIVTCVGFINDENFSPQS
jgi:hypothetical protein